MGKKQHSKDRMYITKTEWATEWGGAKSKENRTPFKSLPFYCCSLTFLPFEDPVCTSDGSVFEITTIVPYIRKFGKHPVTGAPLKGQDLIPLIFHKNSEGEYHCPVLNKVFTEFTHIVAVKTTGNVFCYENPNAVDSKVTVEFDHVKYGLKIDDEELKKMNSDPACNINVSGNIKQMLADLGTEKAKEIALHGGSGNKARNERAAAIAAILESRSKIKEDSKAEEPKQTYSVVDAASASVFGRSADAAKAGSSDKTAARIAMHMAGDRAPVKSRYSSGAASRSFTSSAFTPVTQNDFELIKVEKTPKKKGYVQFCTTHGDLNIELLEHARISSLFVNVVTTMECPFTEASELHDSRWRPNWHRKRR